MTARRSQRLARGTLFVVVAALLLAGPARADYAGSQTWFNGLTLGQRVDVQLNLAVAGDYDYLIDGVFGPNTYNAIVAFQRLYGMPSPDGVITVGQHDALTDMMVKFLGDIGMAPVRDPENGLTLRVPLAVTTDRVKADRSSQWVNRASTVGVQSFVNYAPSRTVESYFRDVRSGVPRLIASQLGDTYFILYWMKDDGSRVYMRIGRHGNDGLWSGFFVFWLPEAKDLGRRIALAMTAGFEVELRRAPPPPRPQGAATAQIEPPAAKRTEPAAPPQRSTAAGGTAQPPAAAYGSGFVASASGLVVTAANTVDRCSEVEVAGYGNATVVSRDAKTGLAAVLLPVGGKPLTPAAIAERPVALGESVVGLGFPFGPVLGNSLQVTSGIVSADKGFAGNADQFTTTASLEIGLSGGPVVDLNGRVIGVALGKPGATAMLQATDRSSTGANLNFAVNAATLAAFLRPFERKVDAAGPAAAPPSVQSAAAAGRAFTVQVICRPKG